MSPRPAAAQNTTLAAAGATTPGTMARAALALCLGLAALVARPSTAGCVAFGAAPTRVNLIGSRVYVSRVASPCVFTTVLTTGCFAWVPEGFALPPPQLGLRVNMFAATARGRIVAALENGGIAYTDDRGAHWVQSRIEGAPSPRSIAFDDRGETGAAVGPLGQWWSTDDGGTSWRLRREGGPVADYVDVAVAGSSVAVSDAHGGVYVSLDGGLSVRSLASRVRNAMPVMSTAEGAIWVRLEGAQWWRVGRDGTLERRERSPFSDP